MRSKDAFVIGCEPHVTAIKHNAERRQFEDGANSGTVKTHTQHSKRLTVVFILNYTTALALFLLWGCCFFLFVFSILEPFGKIPASVVTEASRHNLMSSGVLLILIFHISRRLWVEILMWGWVWKKNRPRKPSKNTEDLLHTLKERIGWPRRRLLFISDHMAVIETISNRKYEGLRWKRRITVRSLETFLWTSVYMNTNNKHHSLEGNGSMLQRTKTMQSSSAWRHLNGELNTGKVAQHCKYHKSER